MHSNYSDVIILDRGAYTTCAVNLHGATVSSWRINNREQLFVSRMALFDKKKLIRGGILIVFPRDGYWAFGPHHGFARIIPWSVEKMPERNKHNDIEAVFYLTDDDYTRSIWNFSFKLLYNITLKERQLDLRMTVENTDKKFMFDFEFLFHTYFMVPDVTNCVIHGLQNCEYHDRTKPITGKTKQIDEFTTLDKDGQPINRTYCNTLDEITITNVIGGRTMKVWKRNFSDIAIWNPRSADSKLIELSGNEYRNMLCIAVGQACTPIKLLPGEKYEGKQILEPFPRIAPDDIQDD